MPETTTSVKRALLIGINSYPNLTKFEQLDGCVNDVRLMNQALQTVFGFTKEHIEILTDEMATREGILKAMQSLEQRVENDDIVVLHYSGHGSQITDREGDEPDGLDETLVTYDSARAPGENRDIVDDEIYAWLQRVTAKTPYVTLIFDCCHSGTMARDAFGEKARTVAPDTRPVEELPPSPVTGPTTRSAGTDAGPSGWLPLGQRYVLMAGCKDDECSYEYRDPESNQKHGALSFFLGRELNRANTGTTYRDVYDATRGSVRSNSSKQTVQIEGSLDRELFGVRDIQPMRYISVLSRTEEAVELGAGAAHGLTSGSELNVFPTDAKTDDESSSIGRVVISRVGATTSSASILKESIPGSISEGARAVEQARSIGEMRLRIAIKGNTTEDTKPLEALVEESPLLLSAPVDEAEICIYLLSERASVTSGDPVPQLGMLRVNTWASVGRDGRLAMPPRAATEPQATSIVCDNLEVIAKFNRTLNLYNPDSATTLQRAVEVQLKRQSKSGSWESAEPDSESGEVSFTEGEQLGLSIINNHSEAVYLYVLDFGLSNRIAQLYPVAGASEALAPGNTLDIGIRDGDELVLGFPDTFPFVEEPGEATPVKGVETLKVFVTSKPADFSSLVQEGVRSAYVDDSPLGALLSLTQTGRSTRDLSRPQKPKPDEDWAAINRAFTLYRKRSHRVEGDAASLDASGTALSLSGVTLRTPGVNGIVRVIPSEERVTRGSSPAKGVWMESLERAGIQRQQTVEIESVRTRSLSGVDPAIQLSVEDPGLDVAQCVLYTDESGIATWQFQNRDEVKTRGEPTRTYSIDRAEPAPTSEPATRGIAATVGKKVLEVLAFPLMDPLLGMITESFVKRWEVKNRPHHVRSFTPGNFQSFDPQPDGADALAQLSNGRSLLFLHGPFFRSHSTFSELHPDVLAELHREYDGRVFAFDHPTLAHDPKENAKWLLENLPAGDNLDLDFICHSRGGLVGRAIAERQSEFSLGSRSLRIRNMAFVATPNSGTALADAQHLGKLVDTYTNLLAFIPDNVVTEVLDTLIAVVKQLAVGAIKGLDGLQAMKPGSDFQNWINASEAPEGTRYFAVAAEYSAKDPGLKSWASGRLAKAIFGDQNDLVVPTEGVYEANGAGGFPIEDRLVYEADAGISHFGFFSNRDVQQQLLTWLQK